LGLTLNKLTSKEAPIMQDINRVAVDLAKNVFLSVRSKLPPTKYFPGGHICHSLLRVMYSTGSFSSAVPAFNFGSFSVTVATWPKLV
jgi:hypothetical protein